MSRARPARVGEAEAGQSPASNSTREEVKGRQGPNKRALPTSIARARGKPRLHPALPLTATTVLTIGRLRSPAPLTRSATRIAVRTSTSRRWFQLTPTSARPEHGRERKEEEREPPPLARHEPQSDRERRPERLIQGPAIRDLKPKDVPSSGRLNSPG